MELPMKATKSFMEQVSPLTTRKTVATPTIVLAVVAKTQKVAGKVELMKEAAKDKAKA